MIEDQHNDNLERFFKANLEGYGPAPSDDFWSRMEGAIPPKPPFWHGWKLALLKWSGVALLLAILMGVIVMWQRDHRKVKKLNKTVAEQKAQLKAFEAQTVAPGGSATKSLHHVTTDQLTDSKKATTTEEESLFSLSPIRAISKQQATQSYRTKPGLASANQAIAQYNSPLAAKTNDRTVAENEQSNQFAIDKSVNALIDPSATTLQDIPSEFSPEPQNQDRLQAPSLLAALDASVLPIKKHVPLNKHKLRRPSNPYPGFSVEVGATAFRMPLGRLFEQDTFLSGRTGISYGTGVRVNYEINSTTSFQIGYQFNNLRARRLALRYNQFPFMLQQRWAWSRRGYLEGKVGVSVNSLVNTNADSDGGTVKGLKTTWMGVHTAISAAFPISDKVKLVIGPSAGFSATPMTTGRHSWELGIAASMRYQL